MPLSDSLAQRIGTKTKKGTRITESLVSKVKSDETELEVIADNRDAVVEAMNTAIIKALYAVGEAAETHAKMLAPVDTGRLRNSITFVLDPAENEVYIGTNVEYAKYQENGERAANGGRGFLRPAANDYADEYRRIFKDNFQNA